jgi:hypothetical protein
MLRPLINAHGFKRRWTLFRRQLEAIYSPVKIMFKSAAENWRCF